MCCCCYCCLQKELKQQERFSVLVNELKTAETIPFKTTVLSLINCIIGGTQELLQRNRIRNEFIGKIIQDEGGMTFRVTACNVTACPVASCKGMQQLGKQNNLPCSASTVNRSAHMSYCKILSLLNCPIYILKGRTKA